MSEDRETGAVDPSGFRKRLREDVAADYELIRGVLLRAMDAEKEVTLRCGYCKKSSKQKVPDYAAANKAVELYMTAGFGRAESESRVSPEDEASLEAHKIPDEELFERRARWFSEHLSGASDEERARVLDKYGLSTERVG